MQPDGITGILSRSAIIELFKEKLKGYNILTSTSELEDIFSEVANNFYKNIEDYIKPIPEAINFAKQYTGLPTVFTEKSTGGPATVFANAGDITSTGFNMYLQRTSVTATSIMWVAIGNGTDIMPE
jgi:hypothetical protein